MYIVVLGRIECSERGDAPIEWVDDLIFEMLEAETYRLRCSGSQI